MNNIPNYGMTNYQIGFQAKGGKKVVKTLADLKSMTPMERQKYNAKKIWDKFMKMDIQCKCNGSNVDEGINPFEALQTMYETPLG